MGYRLVLASASPRRREILSQAGIEYTVMPSQFDETSVKKPEECAVLTENSNGFSASTAYAESARKYVEALSLGKAREIFGRVVGGESRAPGDGLVVLGADTVVVSRGSILNKPKDREDAARMLRRLQGDVHEVYTGVAICFLGADKAERTSNFSVCTEVHFYPVSEEEVQAYLDCGEYADKAGAYAIQGKSAVFVREIRGDYYNVVGLPLSALVQELKKLGWNV